MIYVSLVGSIETETQLNDTRYTEQQAEIQSLTEQIIELSEAISDLQSQIEDMRFEPLDIPLDPDLQAFTYYQSHAAGTDPGIVFAVMDHESGFQEDAINYNRNGSIDIGLMQINSCNWDWLATEGIDVHEPKDNIRAGILILSMHLEDHSMDEALAAYAAGRSGMQQGRGFWFADEIRELSNDYK